MKIPIVSLVSMLLAGSAFADDPGVRDSLIIETVYAELGDSTADVNIYVTSDDSIVFYIIPLTWYPDSVNYIYPTAVSYFYPLTYWDDLYDSILYDQGFIRMLGWENGGSPAPPIFTNN
jgi:hypothetical protein